MIVAAPGTLDSVLDAALRTLSSLQPSVLRNPYSALRLSQVGLTVPVGRASHPPDQQGRWSLPSAQGIRERFGVSGWPIRHQVQSTLHSIQYSVL